MFPTFSSQNAPIRARGEVLRISKNTTYCYTDYHIRFRTKVLQRLNIATYSRDVATPLIIFWCWMLRKKLKRRCIICNDNNIARVPVIKYCIVHWSPSYSIHCKANKIRIGTNEIIKLEKQTLNLKGAPCLYPLACLLKVLARSPCSISSLALPTSFTNLHSPHELCTLLCCMLCTLPCQTLPKFLLGLRTLPCISLPKFLRICECNAEGRIVPPGPIESVVHLAT